MEVIRGSGRSAYELLCQRGEDGEREGESAVSVLSRDGSAQGQDYLLTVFRVRGENKLLLIFAVKCLS